jgi:hypothetical protein
MNSWSNPFTKPQPSSRGGHADETSEAAEAPGGPTDSPCHAIHIDSCAPFQRIAVRTLMSDYEVVVLPGSSGAVLIRGGRYFNDFWRAQLDGSTLGGTAIRIRTIEVGCRLELHVLGALIVTSTIQAISRVKDEPHEVRAM